MNETTLNTLDGQKDKVLSSVRKSITRDPAFNVLSKEFFANSTAYEGEL